MHYRRRAAGQRREVQVLLIHQQVGGDAVQARLGGVHLRGQQQGVHARARAVVKGRDKWVRGALIQVSPCQTGSAGALIAQAGAQIAVGTVVRTQRTSAARACSALRQSQAAHEPMATTGAGHAAAAQRMRTWIALGLRHSFYAPRFSCAPGLPMGSDTVSTHKHPQALSVVQAASESGCKARTHLRSLWAGATSAARRAAQRTHLSSHWDRGQHLQHMLRIELVYGELSGGMQQPAGLECTAKGPILSSFEQHWTKGRARWYCAGQQNCLHMQWEGGGASRWSQQQSEGKGAQSAQVFICRARRANMHTHTHPCTMQRACTPVDMLWALPYLHARVDERQHLPPHLAVV